MGVKAWFIAYSDEEPKNLFAGDRDLDEAASEGLARRLFPDAALTRQENCTFGFPNPGRGELLVGCYPHVRIVAHKDLANDHPSRIAPRWVDPALGRHAYVHATHSVVDWFAFALWRDGRLVRSLSLSPDDDVIEDKGEMLDFEKPFWAGEHPVETEEDEQPYPLDFHPLDLASAAMQSTLGFALEGWPKDWVCNPDELPVLAFSVKRRWSWRFW
jgi:hypothetical protein